MTFDLLLKELDSLNLPNDEYAVTSSGTLAVRGIREAADIDLIVTDKLWSELATKYPVLDLGDCKSIKTGNLEILGDFKGDRLYSTEEQIDKADLIGGHRYVNLGMIKEFKKALGREKDVRDLELIDNYLKTASN